MKISLAVKHSRRISFSASCTCLPGLPFLTSSSRSMISSTWAMSCGSCPGVRAREPRAQGRACGVVICVCPELTMLPASRPAC